MQHTNKIFAIGVTMIFLSLVGFLSTVYIIHNNKFVIETPVTDSLSGKVGNYFVDLPEDLKNSKGVDMVARKEGDTVFVYYPDYKAHLEVVNGPGDYQLRLNRNTSNTDVISFTLTDGNRTVATFKDFLLYSLILKDNQ